MKTNFMRCVAIALGMSVCTMATAQNGPSFGEYSAPSKWNNFNIVPPQQPNLPQQTTQPRGYMHTVSMGGAAKSQGNSAAEVLPAPTGAPVQAPPAPQLAPQPKPAAPKPAPGQPTLAPTHGAVPYQTTGGAQSDVACPPGNVQGYSQSGVHQAPQQWFAAPANSPAHHFDGYSQLNGPQAYQGSGYSAQGYGDPGCSSAASCAPGTRPNLSPWFGGFNLLFWQMENNHARRLLAFDTGYGTHTTTSAVDPDSTLGHDLTFGRYLDCGRYGLSVSYMNFDPSQSETLVTSGMLYAPFDSWMNIDVDPGTGAASVYSLYNGAAAYRVRRDVDIQGLEVNLTSFGLMGAQRAAAMCSQGDCAPGALGSIGANLGLGGGCNGYGGATGPLVRSTSGRVRIASSHGFRWFQFKDSFEFAANINGMPGYGATDLYYNVDAENNLFGYQYGSKVTYCLSNRCNLGIGGKFGVYGNRAEMTQRIGTQSALAYEATMPSDVVYRDSSDTVLAGLGEVDLGLGYRLNNAWTVRGGYRMLGAAGVATSTGSLDQDYSAVETSGGVYANDSLLLHGAYVGMDFNW